MTPAQWAPFGWCVECTSGPGEPCHPVSFKTSFAVYVVGDVDLPFPHEVRTVDVAPDDLSNMVRAVVDLSIREGVTVRPGDTLIVRIDPPEQITGEESQALTRDMAMIRQFLNTKVPAGSNVAIIAMAGELGVVRGEQGSAASGSAAGGQEDVGGRREDPPTDPSADVA